MRLVDLQPEWITPDMFIFKSPTGHGDWLTCKRIPLSFKEQYDLIYPRFKGKIVVQTKEEMAWNFTGNDFTTLTVTPSIDASASGNWHGFITQGEIR